MAAFLGTDEFPRRFPLHVDLDLYPVEVAPIQSTAQPSDTRWRRGGCILGAIDLHRLHQVSFWDGLSLRAAIDARCKTLYSEDLQDGSSIAGIEIRNPFRQEF
jgi:hypothetical protein